MRERVGARPAVGPAASVAEAFKGTDAEAVTEARDGTLRFGLALRFEAEGGSLVRSV